jgi:hypothetical protein
VSCVTCGFVIPWDELGEIQREAEEAAGIFRDEDGEIIEVEE